MLSTIGKIILIVVAAGSLYSVSCVDAGTASPDEAIKETYIVSTYDEATFDETEKRQATNDEASTEATEKETTEAVVEETTVTEVQTTQIETVTEIETKVVETTVETTTECTDEVADESQSYSMSDNTRELFARVLYCEANGTSWNCQVHVASAIINYANAQNSTISEVCSDSSYVVVASYAWNYTPTQTQYDVIDYVMSGGKIDSIKYFRTNYYHSFGTPYCSIDNVYFSC